MAARVLGPIAFLWELLPAAGRNPDGALRCRRSSHRNSFETSATHGLTGADSGPRHFDAHEIKGCVVVMAMDNLPLQIFRGCPIDDRIAPNL